MLTETPALAFNDARKPVVISADASRYGIGADIFQQFGDVVGLESFKLLTDHRSLVPFINTGPLDRTPVRS